MVRPVMRVAATEGRKERGKVWGWGGEGEKSESPNTHFIQDGSTDQCFILFWQQPSHRGSNNAAAVNNGPPVAPVAMW